MTNEAVISALIKEDKTVLIWLLRTHRDRSVGYLVNKVMKDNKPENIRLASDLFTESLITFVVNVRTGRLSSLDANVGTYLTAVMKNKFFEELRRRKRPPLTFSYQEEGLDEEVQELRQSLLRHLRELGDKCRQLLTFFYYDQLSFDEIMTLVEYKYPSITAARMQKVHCMNKLRLKLGVIVTKRSRT